MRGSPMGWYEKDRDFLRPRFRGLDRVNRPNPEPLEAEAVTRNNPCRLLDIALATVVDAVIATDSAEQITYLNPAAESITGWRPIEAVGKQLTTVFFLIDRETDKVIEKPLDRTGGHA